MNRPTTAVHTPAQRRNEVGALSKHLHARNLDASESLILMAEAAGRILEESIERGEIDYHAGQRAARRIYEHICQRAGITPDANHGE